MSGAILATMTTIHQEQSIVTAPPVEIEAVGEVRREGVQGGIEKDLVIPEGLTRTVKHLEEEEGCLIDIRVQALWSLLSTRISRYYFTIIISFQ